MRIAGYTLIAVVLILLFIGLLGCTREEKCCPVQETISVETPRPFYITEVNRVLSENGERWFEHLNYSTELIGNYRIVEDFLVYKAADPDYQIFDTSGVADAILIARNGDIYGSLFGRFDEFNLSGELVTVASNGKWYYPDLESAFYYQLYQWEDELQALTEKRKQAQAEKERQEREQLKNTIERIINTVPKFTCEYDTTAFHKIESDTIWIWGR